MGDRGPKPKPTHLRLLEGNPGKRPFNPAEAKVPLVKEIGAPGWFNDRRKEIFKEVCDSLAVMNGLSNVDSKMLEQFADTLAETERISMKIQSLGDTVMTTKNQKGEAIGAKTVPYFQQLMQLKIMSLRYANHFGLTPSARARIVFLGSGGKPEEDDPYDV